MSVKPPSPFDALFKRRRGLIKPGLERIEAADQLMGFPIKSLPSVLVAGTNGKGSTCGYMALLADALGLRVGVFSSPHIVNLKERFQTNEHTLEDEEILSLLSSLERRLGKSFFEELSFFEISALLAGVYFKSRNLDLVIFEVGLGGRWDATNTCDPSVSVVTSIGLDHQEYLGNTLLDIFSEKIQIGRKGRPIVFGNQILQDRSLFQFARQTCLAEGFLMQAELSLPEGWEEPSMPRWAAENLMLAKQGLELFVRQEFPAKISLLNEACFLSGLDQRSFTPHVLNGRNQFLHLSNGERLVLDVSHNLDAAQSLVASVRARGFQKSECSLLLSVVGDKDIEGMVNLYKNEFDSVILYPTSDSRCDANRLQTVAADYGLRFAPDFQGAWKLGKVMGSPGPMVVSGSFAAVSEAFLFFNAKAKKVSCFNQDLFGEICNQSS